MTAQEMEKGGSPKRGPSPARERESLPQGAIFRALLETTLDGILIVDPNGAIIDVNESYCRMLQRTRAELIEGTGADACEFVPPESRAMVRQVFRRVFQTGRSEKYEMKFPGAHGRPAWYQTRVAPMSQDGEVRRLLVVTTEITERKRAEEAAEFLVEAGCLLSSSLDHQLTLPALAELAVARIGDCCQVDLLDEDGKLRTVATAHVGPGGLEILEALRRSPPDPLDTAGPFHVLRTGKPELVEAVRESSPAGAAQGPARPRSLEGPEPVSSICVPLSSQGRALGTLTFATSKSKWRYLQADLALALQLAGMASSALENARLYRDAQEAIRIRENFLSVAGHELKTPLTALNIELYGISRLSAIENSGPKIREKSERARRSVDSLTRLIDALLDVSRIGLQSLALELEELDLSSLVRETAGRLSEQLRRARCDLRLSATQPIFCRGDRLRLEQVVNNLLSNAIKYGAGAPIEVEIAREGDLAIIRIRDFGIGISPADQARIFLRFERAVSERHFGGLGLGLWIVRQIANAFGGTVTVQSELGKGSVFEFAIPDSPRRPDPRPDREGD